MGQFCFNKTLNPNSENNRTPTTKPRMLPDKPPPSWTLCALFTLLRSLAGRVLFGGTYALCHNLSSMILLSTGLPFSSPFFFVYCSIIPPPPPIIVSFVVLFLPFLHNFARPFRCSISACCKRGFSFWSSSCYCRCSQVPRFISITGRPISSWPLLPCHHWWCCYKS